MVGKFLPLTLISEYIDGILEQENILIEEGRTGKHRKLHNQEPRNLYLFTKYWDEQIKEGELGGACSRYMRNGKWI
jgi:hypothetical protein